MQPHSLAARTRLAKIDSVRASQKTGTLAHFCLETCIFLRYIPHTPAAPVLPPLPPGWHEWACANSNQRKANERQPIVEQPRLARTPSLFPFSTHSTHHPLSTPCTAYYRVFRLLVRSAASSSVWAAPGRTCRKTVSPAHSIGTSSVVQSRLRPATHTAYLHAFYRTCYPETLAVHDRPSLPTAYPPSVFLSGSNCHCL